MLNNENLILVAYFDVSKFNREKGIKALIEFENYIKKQFNKGNDDSNNDDSLVILVIPNNYTKIELLNVKYPEEYDKFKESYEQIIDDYYKNINN